MAHYDNILDTIGNTPLVSLQAFGHDVAPRLYGKLESTNPGGSMKDRAALGMIEWAEREHGLTAGSRIIVCTSGNMGVGMAMVCAVKGYQLMCLVDAKINPATERCLRVLGAEVIKVYQRDATGGYTPCRWEFLLKRRVVLACASAKFPSDC